MGIHKKIFLVLLFILFTIGIAGYVSAANENITYKAEYNDATSYKLTITGLESEEGYNYYAMICQETDVTGSDFFTSGTKAFSIKYNLDTNTWEGDTSTAHDGITKMYGAFEKAGQYYAYIARASESGASSGAGYEIIDGPTEIETPDLPPLGERISINASAGSGTNYSIKVNARNTMLYGRVQRTINFYVGEVTDTDLLKKLSEEGEGAYDELMAYAKQQVPNLEQDSFRDTTSGVLDYNIVADYPIEDGKYYFIYSILDNENGTYNDVEDIEIYNGEVKSNGEAGLTTFKYVEPEITTPDGNNTNTQNNQVNRNNDNTTAGKILPKAGSSLMIIVGIVLFIILASVLCIKNKQYKDIK